MSESRGLVVIFPNGTIARSDQQVVEEGARRTASIDIDGTRYAVYRYSLHAADSSTLAYGFVAAVETPSLLLRHDAATELFGPAAFGIERLERVAPFEPSLLE